MTYHCTTRVYNPNYINLIKCFVRFIHFYILLINHKETGDYLFSMQPPLVKQRLVQLSKKVKFTSRIISDVLKPYEIYRIMPTYNEQIPIGNNVKISQNIG